MDGPSGKKPVQTSIPLRENNDVPSQVKPVKERGPGKLTRQDSGYYSDEDQKSIIDYKVEKSDLTEQPEAFLSRESSLGSDDEQTDELTEDPHESQRNVLQLNSAVTEVVDDVLDDAIKELQLEATRVGDTLSEAAALSNRSGEKADVSVTHPDKSHGFVRVYEKEMAHKMASQLLQRAEKFISGYSLHSQLVNLQVRQAIKAFEQGGPQKAGLLFEALNTFAQFLGDKKEKELEIAFHKTKPRAEVEREYDALASAFKLLKDVVKDIHFDNLTRECKQRLRDAFSHFENPGEESALRARAQAGVDVNILKIDAGLEVSTKLLGCDDTMIRLFHNKNFSLRLTGGSDLVKGYIAGAVGEIKGKVFKNIDEFIDYYGDSFLLALHGKQQPSMRVWRDTAQIKKSKALKKRIIENISQLEHHFKTLELDIVREGLMKYGTLAKAVPLMIKRETKEGQVGARVVKSFGLDLTNTKWKNTFTKKTPILAQLKKHPEWCNDYDSSYFNMDILREKEGYLDQLNVVYGENLGNALTREGSILYKGGKVIPLLSNRLEMLKGVVNQKTKSGKILKTGVVSKELIAMQGEVKQLITQNYQDYKFYCDQINARKQSESKKLHPAVALLMQQRGTNKVPGMLQRFMVTHARLSNIYKQTELLLSQNKTAAINSDWLDFIEQDLSVPDIYVSQKNIEKYLMLNKELHGSIKFNDTIARLALGPFEGLVDVRHMKNRNESNPDSDGNYVSVVLRGSMVGNASLAEGSLMESITKLLGTLPGVDGEAPLMIEATSGVETVLQGSKHLKMELFFMKGDDGCYHEQYKRLLSGEELAVKGGGKVPVAGLVSLSGQVAADRYTYHFIGEELGTNTMSYIQSRYNGWKVGNKPEKWDVFLEDSKNRERLAKIMVNMALADTNAGREFRNMKNLIKEHYQAVCDSKNSSVGDRKKAQAILGKLDSGEWDSSFANLEKGYLAYHSTTTLPSESATRQHLKSAAKRTLTKKYETLVEETKLNNREKFALKSVVKSDAFTFAMHSLQDILEACHQPYLKEAESRFQDVNPNQPVPYKKA